MFHIPRSFPQLALILVGQALATETPGEVNLRQPWVAWLSILLSLGILSWIVSEVFGRQRNVRLQKDSSLIRLVLDELSEGVTVLDQQGNVTWMGESARRLFGWTLSVTKGRSFFDLVHADDRARVLEQIAALEKRPGKVEVVEFRFRRSDGVFLPIECTIRNLLEFEGIHGILIAGRDLSERILARHQLEEAKLHAERVVVEKNEFLAILGHEVRTPLQAIFAALDVVLRQIPVGEPSRQVVEHATRSAESLLQILDDLLTMSRAEAKLAPVRRISFDPVALTQEIVGLFDIPARKQGGSIHSVFSEASHPMVGDPARVRQILSNLAGNAVRYAGDSKIEIFFQESASTHGVPEAVWEVRDRGPGLQEGDTSRLFRKWERGREDIPGSGLGLAIVADIVQAMKGTLQAFPREGGGLVVRLRFPMTAPESLGSDTHHELLVAPPAKIVGRRPRILVAEDDRTNQVVIRKQLESSGCEPIITGDGAQAVAKFKEDTFDLILLDCQMPVMDGFAAAREIRNLERESGKARIPVLAVTAWAMQEDQTLCLQSGMDEVLTKPLRPNELASALLRWIGHQKA